MSIPNTCLSLNLDALVAVKQKMHKACIRASRQTLRTPLLCLKWYMWVDSIFAIVIFRSVTNIEILSLDMDGSPSTDPSLCFKRRKYLIIQKTSTSRSSSSNKVQKKNDDEADEKDGPSARRLTNKKLYSFVIFFASTTPSSPNEEVDEDGRYFILLLILRRRPVGRRKWRKCVFVFVLGLVDVVVISTTGGPGPNRYRDYLGQTA